MTLVVFILAICSTLIFLVLWLTQQQNAISQKSIHYYLASTHHLDVMAKEVLHIKSHLLTGDVHPDEHRNVDHVNQALYIIKQHHKILLAIQSKYQESQFEMFLQQLQRSMDKVLREDTLQVTPQANIDNGLFLELDALLLKLEQIGKLHEVANNKLFMRQVQQGQSNFFILVLTVVFVSLFCIYIIRKALLSVNAILHKQRQMDDELHREKEQIQITLQSIADAVISTDSRGLITYLNPVAEKLTQWSNEEASGQPLMKVFNIINEETGQPATEIVRRVLREGVAVGLANHTVLINREGGKRAIEDSAAPIRDSRENITGIVIVFHDVTHARKMAQEMTWQASHDALTHLANRHMLEKHLGNLIESISDTKPQHAFLYIDLDQFKIVNDTCGHIAGDELLKQVAVLLKSQVRDVDIVARLGGDEFGVLLESCPVAQAEHIAQGIREAIQEFRFVWEEKVFTIGLSIGLVPITSALLSLNDIMRAADIACYAAKDIGGNRIHIYHADDEELSVRQGEMEWISRIHNALEQDRFVLYQQRILPLKTNGDANKYHFEVLLRMLGKNNELISPMMFIPAAERYNLMPAIDRWVIKNAFSEIKRLRAHEDVDFFSVNISGQTLGDDGILDFVIQELRNNRVAEHEVCFEITETAAIANFPQAIEFISTLKNKGCRFALDDFGSGLSSFGYLKNLPVDFLKIDGTFVQDMLNDPIDRAMVESINSIGQLMGIETIAEFVETEAIASGLLSIGVNYGQGFGLCKPELLNNK